MAEELRRPIASRDTAWAARIAKLLASWKIRPNTISAFSSIFAGMAGVCLWATSQVDSAGLQLTLLFGAILGMQLRLLCNLFDGMVAIEEGQKTPSGAIFNELPDRFSDAFILIGAGYCTAGGAAIIELGWLAAVLAVIAAYVRSLGASVGTQQYFLGPMAKQHRMALLTVASVLAIVMKFSPVAVPVFPWALGIMSLGLVVTIYRRTQAVIRELEAK